MAKSRQERRARRARQQAGEPRTAGRALPQRESRPVAESRVDIPRGGFVRESVAELKKVEWPNRPQVLTGTIVVIIACAIVGAYLWVADQAFRTLVEKVIL
ncbi:MAG: preprotein translocase subunit SecE [Gaiellaceae bacterium]